MPPEATDWLRVLPGSAIGTIEIPTGEQAVGKGRPRRIRMVTFPLSAGPLGWSTALVEGPVVSRVVTT